MGKKNAPAPNAVPNKEAFQRMNFLYQAAFLMTNLSQAPPPPQKRPKRKFDDPKQRATPTPSDPTTTDFPSVDDDRASSESASPKRKRRRARGGTLEPKDYHSLAGLGRFYAHTMKSVSRRMVLRSDPHIKRSICKHCDIPLVNSVTAETRLQRSPEPHMTTTCLQCGTPRHLLVNRKDFTLWTDRPENIYAPPENKGDPVKTGANKKRPKSEEENSGDGSAVAGEGLSKRQQRKEYARRKAKEAEEAPPVPTMEDLEK